MNKTTIPAHWRVRRSTPIFTPQSVPIALLHHHNTAAGVMGQLCVLHGHVTYYGFADEQASEPEVALTLSAGQFALSPPQYWHRVALSDDARFSIHFWAAPDDSATDLYHARQG